MATEFKAASTYLKQIAAEVKRPIQWAFLFGCVKTVAIIVQFTAIALLAQTILADGQAVFQHTLAWWLLLAATIGRVIAPYGQQHYANLATKQAAQAARQRLFNRWQQQLHAGESLSAADGALQLEPIESLKGYFNRYLVQQYLVVVSPLLVLFTCFYINPVVGILLLFSGPIIPLFMALVGIGAEKLSQQHAEQMHALSRVFTDKLRNLTTIQLFNAGEAAANDVAQAGEDYRKATMSTLRIAFLSSAVLEFFSSVAIAGVALYVGFGLLGYIDWLGADQLTLFSGLLVLMLAPEYFAPLRQFAQSYHDRAAAVGAATLLANRHQTANEAFVPKLGERSDALVSWRNLSVTYRQRQTIAFTDNDIKVGRLNAIGGDSGAGKTTLLRVLLGQQPFQGHLHWHGANDRQNNIAYFAQKPFIKADTLRNNINLFEEHSDAAIWSALALVKLDYLPTTLRYGLDTVIGEGGLGLSGGELRRIALVRCLLSKRRIIIADEPTENLDAASAAAIREVLGSLSRATGSTQSVTVVVATHDPQLLAMSDHKVEVSND